MKLPTRCRCQRIVPTTPLIAASPGHSSNLIRAWFLALGIVSTPASVMLLILPGALGGSVNMSNMMRMMPITRPPRKPTSKTSDLRIPLFISVAHIKRTDEENSIRIAMRLEVVGFETGSANDSSSSTIAQFDTTKTTYCARTKDPSSSKIRPASIVNVESEHCSQIDILTHIHA